MTKLTCDKCGSRMRLAAEDSVSSLAAANRVTLVCDRCKNKRMEDRSVVELELMHLPAEIAGVHTSGLTAPLPAPAKNIKYKRILLKLGGESLADSNGDGINPAAGDTLAQRIQAVRELGIQVAVVIGAGNLWRGREGLEHGMERATADYMGMIATVINSLALMDALERQHVVVRVQSAIEMRAVAEPYIRRRAIRHLEKGRVVIFAAGTGNPFFTTDTAAALRAAEMGCEVLLKATNVDGVYTADPKKDPSAKRYDRISHQEALEKDLKVMDGAAFALARENRLPIIVFSMASKGAVEAVLRGEGRSTLVG